MAGKEALPSFTIAGPRYGSFHCIDPQNAGKVN
jgi:hypothetical protein